MAYTDAEYNDLLEGSKTIIADYNNFDLAMLVRQSIQHDGQSLNDDLFSLSPLSSPDPSPPSSPRHGTISLPPTIDAIHPMTSSKPPSNLTQAPISDRVKSQKDKHKARSHRLRSQWRKNQQASQFSTAANPAFINRHPPSQNPIHTSVDVTQCATTKSGFIAQKTEYDERTSYCLKAFIGEKARFEVFRLERWDGRVSKPIYDSQRRLVAILSGQPADCPGCLDWNAMTTRAAQRMRHVQNVITRRIHRRRLSYPEHDEALLKELNESEEFRRISGFSSSAFATWAPKLHNHYVEKLSALYEHDPTLRRTFPNSVFAAATYNLGPQSVCFPHTDFANLAFGWCAVVSLGNFDYTKGGHLILFQCCLVVEFPLAL
ncbi:hypothetical protein BJ165DRAFT_1534661 [Panaeolus papilionaceus]|nr:hypothetical protein BJ165DRAFT_1534661 [Panaeolus papilionaceus]